MSVFILLLFFILGTAIGSFLNVLAYRTVHGDSPFSGRSVCPRCKHRLSWNDLVPVVSYLFLRGKCKYCKKSISLQYPTVEVVTGVLFGFGYLYWYSGFSGQTGFTSILALIYVLFVVSTLIVLTTTDVTSGLLPNSVVLPSVGVVGLYKLFLLGIGDLSLFNLAVDVAAALIVASLFFAVVYLSNEKALGGGDIKLVFLLGLILGWPAFGVGLFLGFLTGGLVAAMLIMTGSKRFGQTLPLGPFLNLGALISFFYGQQLVEIYLRVL